MRTYSKSIARMWGWVVLPALLGAACDQPPYIPPKLDDGEDGTTTCDVQPTLSSLASKYFASSCVFSGCHDARSNEGNLDMEAEDLHAELVGVEADDDNARARGKVLVVPGDPDGSFIVQKVEGRMERDEGKWMPEGTDEPIDPECRIKMLRQWIADGALDN